MEIEQFFELAQDPLWRINHLYTIVDKKENRVPFTPNQVQKRINESKSLRKIVLKARQFGVSTNEEIKLLDWVMFNHNATGCIIAHEQDAIRKLFRIVRTAYNNFPEDLRPTLDRGGGSMYEMYFPEINSRIYCDLEVRGGTIGRLHVSEAAFMKDSSRLKATLQAVPIETGHVTVETTANGMANFFYEMWNDPESIYEKLFFPWYIDANQYRLKNQPIKDLSEDEQMLIKKADSLFGVKIDHEQLAFRRFKKNEMKRSDYDQKKVTFEQEYPEDDKTCFITTGEAVLDIININKMIANSREPIRTPHGIKIYVEPNKNKNYLCAADPAEGVKRDYSSAVVLDTDSLEIVASIKMHLKPSDFAAKLIEMCDMFKDPKRYPPLIAVERNNHGHAVLLELDNLEYPNIYNSPDDERPGWKTNGITRPLMVDKLVEAIDSGYLKIYDKEILSECLTLINNKGKIEAAPGKHDDSLIACAIALQIKPDSRFSYDDLESRIKL